MAQFVVHMAPGIQLKGQGDENVVLEDGGTIVKINGLMDRQLGCFVFYTPTPISFSEQQLCSVKANGVVIFSR